MRPDRAKKASSLRSPWLPISRSFASGLTPGCTWCQRGAAGGSWGRPDGDPNREGSAFSGSLDWALMPRTRPLARAEEPRGIMAMPAALEFDYRDALVSALSEDGASAAEALGGMDQDADALIRLWGCDNFGAVSESVDAPFWEGEIAPDPLRFESEPPRFRVVAATVGELATQEVLTARSALAALSDLAEPEEELEPLPRFVLRNALIEEAQIWRLDAESAEAWVPVHPGHSVECVSEVE